MPNVNAVLFARDMEKLAEFYRQTLGLKLSKNEKDHVVLTAPGFDLIVHQIPGHIAESITIEQPPRRRERAAIKLGFPVKSIEDVRALAASLGGEMDPPEKEWAYGTDTVCAGHDPEGNIFQVSLSSRND